MNLEKLPVDCDLSETALDAAANVAGCGLSDVIVYTTRHCAVAARRLQGYHGFELVIVPDEMLATRWTWAIEFCGRLVGSTPSA